MAFDPSDGRFLWGNYSNFESREQAIGQAFLSGSGNGGISPITAPVYGPQDPILLKSPVGVTPPTLTKGVSGLTCSQGTWSQDYPGSFVYGAPTSYAYSWALNGVAIPGAVAPSIVATAPGSYSCAVTAANVGGSATQSATAAATVNGATLSAALKSKKKFLAVPGRTLPVSFVVRNSGDLASAPVRVCAAKLTKKAKKGLAAPKCAALPQIAALGSATATLKVKVKKDADGTYKFTAQVKAQGAATVPVTVSIKVPVPRKPHAKKH